MSNEKRCRCGHTPELHSVGGEGGCDSLYCTCSQYKPAERQITGLPGGPGIYERNGQRFVRD